MGCKESHKERYLAVLCQDIHQNWTCVKSEPYPVDYGYSNFNNILFSVMTTFHIVSLDSWTNYLYHLMDTENPVICVIWCVTMIMLVNFIIVNILIAIINSQFNKIRVERKMGGAEVSEVSSSHAPDGSPSDRKSTRLNSSHLCASRMPSSA